MGNQQITYNVDNAIKYDYFATEPEYHYVILVDYYNASILPHIRNQILDIENIVLFKNIDKIMYCLSRTIEKNTPKLLDQTDYFLFRHNNIPLLKIHNTSAQINKWASNGNPEIFNCFVVDLENIKAMTHSDYSIFATA